MDITAIEFYWRPGCPFCMRLESKLNSEGIPLDKRNIWEDRKAAEFVRSVADGNETVPTIRIGEESRVNPSPREVKKILKNVAPHLLEG